jgi:DnaJ-class molecular chaperone
MARKQPIDPYVTAEDAALYGKDAARIQADRRAEDRPAPPRGQRCEPCCGTGIRGRWRSRARGRVWKIEACRVCQGRGEVYR